jgi:ankyrin repeat protein
VNAVVRFKALHKGSYAALNARWDHGYTALMLAIYYRKHALVALLADCCDVNAVNSKGSTPLMMAAEMGNVEALQILLQRDDIELEVKNDFHGDTALFFAARHGTEAALKILLDHHASTTYRNYSGKNAAEEARAYRRVDQEKIILTYQPALAVDPVVSAANVQSKFILWHSPAQPVPSAPSQDLTDPAYTTPPRL